MSGVFRAEWLKLRKRPATMIIGVIWVALVLLLGYLLPYLIFKNPPRRAASAPDFDRAAELANLLPQNLVHWFVPSLSNLGATLVVILAALVGGSEYGWATLKTILTQRPGRLRILTGKLLALTALLVLFVVLGYVAAAIGSLIVAHFQHAAVAWPAASALLKSAGAMLLIFAAWAALGFGLATIFRGTALAIGLGLVYGLVIDGLISAFSGVNDVVKAVSQGLLGSNAGALADSFRATGPRAGFFGGGAQAIAGPGQAALVLGIYVVVFVALAGILLHRRDVA